mgnify:CR=1 FL=1
MNKIAIGVIALGIIITLAGIIVLSNLEDDAIETAEEGLLYEGADGEMEITGKSNPNEQGFGLYVHIKGTYEGGGEGGYNEERGNNTWDLTEEDCDLVRTFTLTHNEDGTQVFIPRCNYIEDDGGSADDDDWIAVGTLCTQQTAGDRNRTGEGCPDGTYTWDTGGVKIMVYDLDKLAEGIIGAILGALGSFGACCCGSIVLLGGIIMAFTMQEEDPNQWVTAPGEDVSTPEPGTGWDDRESAWSEKKDYIRNDEKDGQNP